MAKIDYCIGCGDRIGMFSVTVMWLENTYCEDCGDTVHAATPKKHAFRHIVARTIRHLQTELKEAKGGSNKE